MLQIKMVKLFGSFQLAINDLLSTSYLCKMVNIQCARAEPIKCLALVYIASHKQKRFVERFVVHLKHVRLAYVSYMDKFMKSTYILSPNIKLEALFIIISFG